MNTSSATSDPVVTEIVRNGVIAITEEMKSNLMRTAYNMIIYEALDFTVGLFTEKGETISIGLGLPMFIRGMAETIKAKLDHYGPENIKPGDILLTNDAYITGSHLNHLTFSMPIFLEDELIGFACCMAHWPDIGGTLDGITTDIYSEGLQIPIVKYQREGVVNDEIVEIIRANVRLPDRAMGDLRAQLTAITTGERRYLELIRRYGRKEVAASISDIMDQSERAARARTLSIPDGVYEAESYMDDDGVSISDRIPIRVKVIVEGDEMTVDLSEVAEQVRGFYNSGITTGHACSQVAFKCITSPTDYPINDGSFRNLRAVVPPGRVISAVKPAPMRWWMTFPMTIVDTVFKALTPAIPERTIAGHHADLVIGMLNGINPRNNEFYIAFIGPTGGGWGAKQREDGVSATVCINDGDTHNSPAEQLESKYPFLIENYALREDSGGAGEYRGGLGCENTVQARADFMLNAQVERMHCKPWGLEGGKEAEGNSVVLRADGQWKEDYPNAKLLTARIKVGDAFAVRSGGGGGFGNPRKRPAETVADDVRQGYVSVQSARNDYGVVCDEFGSLDAAATKKLRS
ncbi:MAG: hydantoinase B/oxoprolinase family protein [Pseudomonadota bacterium]|nr:hydantoinase B/oxoprolinase family protein [Pseudomonadota bacterium]